MNHEFDFEMAEITDEDLSEATGGCGWGGWGWGGGCNRGCGGNQTTNVIVAGAPGVGGYGVGYPAVPAYGGAYGGIPGAPVYGAAMPPYGGGWGGGGFFGGGFFGF